MKKSEASGLRWTFVWQVARKELISTLRDRRALVSSIALPLLIIPLFTVLFPLLLGQASSSQSAARQKVGVIGTLPKALRARLTQGSGAELGVTLLPVQNARQAVQGGEVEAVLVAPAALPTQAGQASGTVQLYAKLGTLKAETGVIRKLEGALNSYNTALVTADLKRRGLAESYLTPLRVQRLDASRPQEAASGPLAFLIPMFLMQFILAGGMATAIDSTAGEKERGTLEVLLVSPVRRAEVVVGKLLATTTTALLSAGFSLIGLLLSGPLARLLMPGLLIPGQGGKLAGVMGGQLSATPMSVFVLILMAVSVSLLLSALLIAVGIFARSYKEAQTYIAPITLLIVVPALGLQFADFIGRGAGLYLFPVVNAMVVILDVVKGTVNIPSALAAAAANLLFTAVLVGLAIRSFGREAVIFRN